MYKILSYHPSTEDMFTIDPTFGIISIKNVKNVKEQIILNSYQQDMLIKSAKNPRTKAILMLYLQSGLRVMELIGLTLTQYMNRNVEDGNSINLTITKGSYERKIWLTDEVIEAIDEYLLVRKDSSDDNLFISDWGNKMDRSCISRTIKTVSRKSGIFSDDDVDRIANHSMRRAFATTSLNEKGNSINAVALALGHHGLGSVMKYARTDDNTVRSVMVG
jgi:site-specific recombinase XerD